MEDTVRVNKYFFSHNFYLSICVISLLFVFSTLFSLVSEFVSPRCLGQLKTVCCKIFCIFGIRVWLISHNNRCVQQSRRFYSLTFRSIQNSKNISYFKPNWCTQNGENVHLNSWFFIFPISRFFPFLGNIFRFCPRSGEQYTGTDLDQVSISCPHCSHQTLQCKMKNVTTHCNTF